MFERVKKPLKNDVHFHLHTRYTDSAHETAHYRTVLGEDAAGSARPAKTHKTKNRRSLRSLFCFCSASSLQKQPPPSAFRSLSSSFLSVVSRDGRCKADPSPLSPVFISPPTYSQPTTAVVLVLLCTTGSTPPAKAVACALPWPTGHERRGRLWPTVGVGQGMILPPPLALRRGLL